MILNLVKTVLADDIIPSYPGNIFENNGMIDLRDENLSLGNIFSGVLPYVYVFAGLALLLILISGGIGLMTSAGNPDKIKAGYGKITSALIGFFIVFISYIVVMLVETIFGVDIL